MPTLTSFRRALWPLVAAFIVSQAPVAASRAETIFGLDIALHNILDAGTDYIQLLDGRPELMASAFLTTPVALDARTALEVSFEVAAHGDADGFTFAFVNGLSGPSYLGLSGGNLGFFPPADATGHPLAVGPAYAVAFDFFQNLPYGELPGLHLATLDFNHYEPRVQASAPLAINDGRYHVWIELSVPAQKVSVYLGADARRPTLPVLIDHVDFATYLGGLAYPGFTGATGPSLVADLRLESLIITSRTVVPLPPCGGLFMATLPLLAITVRRRARAETSGPRCRSRPFRESSSAV